MSGQEERRTNIYSISNGTTCTVVTTTDHDYSTHDFVRLTDLNGVMPTPRGVDPLNNNRY